MLAGCVQNRNEDEYVVVGKDIEIPIDGCVLANKKILGNSVNPVAFCKCLIPKLYEAYKKDPEKTKLLMEGKFDKDAENDAETIQGFYNECMLQSATTDTMATITITPRMKAQIKQGIKDNFAGTEFEKTNDLDKYCDCLVKGMETELTARQIMSNDSTGNVKLEKIRNRCTQTSLKN